MIMWHEYTRKYRPKHWDDHGKESATKKTSGVRDAYARNKTRQLFDQEDHKIEMGIYGLGNERTLHDYEVYGGFNFKKCKIQDYTLMVKDAPNPSDWEAQFEKKRLNMNVSWDVEHFKAEDIGDYEFITLGVVDKFANNLFRVDFKPSTHPDVFNYTQNSLNVDAMADNKPDLLVMYAYSTKNQWSKRFEKKL
jgi:hypothetical protein